MTTVLTLPTRPATSYNFVRIFYSDSEAILSRVSALCPGSQIFPPEKHLKEFANHINLVKMIFIMWNNFGKEFASEGVEAAYIARTIFFI